jgi:hypothetical protein
MAKKRPVGFELLALMTLFGASGLFAQASLTEYLTTSQPGSLSVSGFQPQSPYSGGVPRGRASPQCYRFR